MNAYCNIHNYLYKEHLSITSAPFYSIFTLPPTLSVYVKQQLFPPPILRERFSLIPKLFNFFKYQSKGNSSIIAIRI